MQYVVSRKGEQLLILDLGSPSVISVKEAHYAAISGKLLLHFMAVMVEKGAQMKAKPHIFKPMSTIVTLEVNLSSKTADQH